MSSPSCITLQHSQKTTDSIEVIKEAASNDTISPDSVISTADIVTSMSCTSISDSVEIIDGIQTPSNDAADSNETLIRFNDDEDDSVSLSCNTITEVPVSVKILDKNTIQHQPHAKKTIQTSSNRDSLTLDLPMSTQSTLGKNSKEQMPKKSTANLEKSLENADIQTIHSDSTQSFEDVQQILLDEANKNETKQPVKDDALLSPQSNDDKSNLLDAKTVTSDHNSGHTSADEIETTTSSDIEIISGPNGDSSSQNSVAGIVVASKSARHGSLPSQYVVFGTSGKKKGHYRELSEASTYSLQSESGSDGYSHSEYEKLAHRINELTDVIEVRECKLVELGRENAQLVSKTTMKSIKRKTWTATIIVFISYF